MTLLFLIIIALVIYLVVKNSHFADNIEKLEREVKLLRKDLGDLADLLESAQAPPVAPEAPKPAATPKPETTAPLGHTEPEKPEGPQSASPLGSIPEDEETGVSAEDEDLLSLEPRYGYAAQEGEPMVSYASTGEPDKPGLSSRLSAAFKDMDWEMFTGTKLFAWLGGLALFIGTGFFVKYSIDRNLIPPALRLAIGALTGLSLIVGSGFLDRLRYNLLRQTLCACGIGVLYTVVFTATLHYQYLSKPTGFFLLTLVSATAFVLSVYYQAISISVLGALGSYATPLIVNTGSGSLPLLLAYLSVVNIGGYMVVKRLASNLLLSVLNLGTLATLLLTVSLGGLECTAMTLALVFAGNMALMSLFLWLRSTGPELDKHLLWSYGALRYSTLLVSAKLLLDPGSGAFLLLTAGMASVLVLGFRHRVWSGAVIPYMVMNFVLSFLWTTVWFRPSEISWDYLTLLVYGALGSLGPVMLIRKYGLDKRCLQWLALFPAALGLLLMVVVFRAEHLSVWFWPLTLALSVLGLGICFLVGSVVQAAALLVCLVLSGLGALMKMPVFFDALGLYGLMLGAGGLVTITIIYAQAKAPDLFKFLNQSSGAEAVQPLGEGAAEGWIKVLPAMGSYLLLSLVFRLQQPLVPHAGMFTLLCFLWLSLFLSRRMSSEQLGIVSLLSALLPQASWALRPDLTPELHGTAVYYSGALFILAVAAPFVFYRSFEKWARVWMGWAVFELAQGALLLYAADHIWPRESSGWVPLVLAFFKLPFLAVLGRRLSGRSERNALLAFHGGVLLLYVSSVPFMLLEQGWIGLTLGIEATLLLWLNHRVRHEGLRYVAAALAPAGLVMLIISLSKMKAPGDMAVLNSATLSMSAMVLSLALAVRLAPFATTEEGVKEQGYYNFTEHFRSLAVGAGFLLLNLVVADLFAAEGEPFSVTLAPDAKQAACHALVALGYGAVLWSSRKHMPRDIRTFGLGLVALGSAALLALPLLFGGFTPGLSPLTNFGIPVYLLAFCILAYLYKKGLQEEDKDHFPRTRTMLLALLLAMAFMGLKVQAHTVLQPGESFHLLFGQNSSMALGSAAGWLAYGYGLLVWPRLLERGFRTAGLVLIALGLGKVALYPFLYRVDFGSMTTLMNMPTLLFAFALALLASLTANKPPQVWPFPGLSPRQVWGVALGLMAFHVLNVEISSAFKEAGAEFSMATHGSLSHQLAYSIGWMLFSIALHIIGIAVKSTKARWSALILLVVTALKTFFLDFWRLGQLYRVASFIGLAVVLILVSFLYQRYLVVKDDGNES